MNTLQKALITAVLLSKGCLVAANESNGYTTSSGLKVIPLLDVKLEHNDNIGSYSSAENPDSSGMLEVKPGLVLESDRNGNQYQIAYQLVSGNYFDSDTDDYLDHMFTTNNFIKINQRAGIGLNYSYLSLHEDRGTGILAGDNLSTIATKPVKYVIHNVNLTHIYGSQNAQGRIESNVRYEQKTYKNYRNLTDPSFEALSTKYKDYDEFGGAVAFYYNIRPATDLLFEVDLANRHYKLKDPISSQSQDNLNTYYWVGAKWDITGKTLGKVRLGLQNKRYKNAESDDFNGFSWDLDLTWSPLNYSTVTLSASQRADDPDQGTSYITKTSFDAAWKHYWLTHFYSNISLGHINDNYSESSREDKLLETTIALGYELRDYVEISAGWRHENNDSSIATNNYKQNVWYLETNFIF
ncbi:MAG: outer membrane beta-barrel protein [Aliivibrio sp.]|nr:outer membrane beta-barrel protein [Aliivibrio sp.]